MANPVPHDSDLHAECDKQIAALTAALEAIVRKSRLLFREADVLEDIHHVAQAALDAAGGA